MSKHNRDEVVGCYGGDAFGNRANTLWRCRQCEGLYVTDGSMDLSVRVGLIIGVSDGRREREHESRLAAIYRDGPLCECEDLAVRAPGKLLKGPWLPLPRRGGLWNHSWNVEEYSEDDL